MDQFTIPLEAFDFYTIQALATLWVNSKYGDAPPQPVVSFLQKIFESMDALQRTYSSQTNESFTRAELLILQDILAYPISSDPSPGEDPKVTQDMNRILASRMRINSFVTSQLAVKNTEAWPFPVKVGQA